MTIPFTFLDKVLLPHDAFQKGVDRLEYFLARAPLDEPEIVPVLGPPGSGKSRLLEVVSSNHPSTRTNDGLNIPIIRVSVPSKPTIKGLGDLILKKLDPEDTRKYTENQMTHRIQVLMHNCGTLLLMLDEFQHFFDRTSKRVWHHVTDWLKVLIDEVGCILVVSGLPDCTTVIKQSPQFRRRCRQKIYLPQFRWENSDEQAQFRGILGGFYGALISQGIHLPNLSEDAWAFRMFCATGGLIGYVKKLLAEVIIEQGSIEQNRALDLKEFENAHKRFTITFEDLSASDVKPFDPDFTLAWTAETAAHVEMIGAAISIAE
jgi:energy-coupling factor transporter ATP-binding protein EcfA2